MPTQTSRSPQQSAPSEKYGADIHKLATRQSPLKRIGKFWHQLGPGLTTGAADDDPSGIATYSQAGSQFGFQMLWLALFTFPLMAIVQEMCARIGLVTGRGLAANIRINYPRYVLYACTVLLFAANVFNIGADLGIMVRATQLIVPGFPFGLLLVGFTVLSLLLQVFVSYARYAKLLKWLALVLLAYVITAFIIPNVNWGDVVKHTLIPNVQFSKTQILLICATLGTTISPYLFFWQTSQEVEQEITEGKMTVSSRQHDASPVHIRQMRVDNWVGMFFSNLVMFFIILTGGAVLHAAGLTNITSAADAAAALEPLAGQGAFILFTVGIVGIGMLAIPVLAGSAAYAIAESFRWREGLYRKLKGAYAFYGVIAIAMGVGFFLNFVGLNPIKALVASAVLNGMIAPVMMYFIVRLSSQRSIMGSYANSPWVRRIGWFTTIAMGVVAVASIGALIVT
jgi:NRAMP (natural resistance-associated macrophage protein)-like metal ion transporter